MYLYCDENICLHHSTRQHAFQKQICHQEYKFCGIINMEPISFFINNTEKPVSITEWEVNANVILQESFLNEFCYISSISVQYQLLDLFCSMLRYIWDILL